MCETAGKPAGGYRDLSGIAVRAVTWLKYMILLWHTVQ